MKMPQTTKELIFIKAVELFANEGYDGVSMKMLAKACGIQPASIYSHYESKEEILHQIYDFWVRHCCDARPPRHEYEEILQTGTAEEILEVFNYQYGQDQEQARVMFDIVRIIWSRLYIDALANELYKTHVMQEGIRYIEEVLGRGIEIGRLGMAKADVEALATTILAIRVFTASAIVSDPDRKKWRDVSVNSIQLLKGMLCVRSSAPSPGGAAGAAS